MREVKYIVRKQFKYAGRDYIPGEEWEPDGSRFDQIIIDQHKLVEIVYAGEPKQKVPRRRVKDAAT